MKNQFTSRIVKLTFAFMFVLLASSCSDDNETLDAAALAKDQINSGISAKGAKVVAAVTYTSTITGNESDVCVDSAQEFTLSGWNGTAALNVKIWDESISDWVSIDSFNGQLASPQSLTYTFPAIGVYHLKYQVSGNAADGGTNGFVEFDVTVVDCTVCTESFSYSPKGGGSYTFTYIPAEDMEDALVEFTFAQGVAVAGLNGFTQNGNGNASVWSTTSSFEACKTYTYEVTLTPDCSGKSGNSNVWTDFKVGGESKKGELANIVITCPN